VRWCHILRSDFIAGKELSFFIDMNEVQSFPHSKKAEQTSRDNQLESFLTVKTKLRFKDGLAEVLKMAVSRLLSTRLPSISSLEPLGRVGEWL